MIRVLVVDDDFRVAQLHAAYVQQVEGFEMVGLAHTAADAIRLAAELKPDAGATYYGIGLAQRKLGDFRAAKQAFKTYLRLTPSAPQRAELEAWIAKWGG